MNRHQEIFEDTIEVVLSSWTALDLAVSHFDGNFREGQRRRQMLAEALSDSIRLGDYTQLDIAEFIDEYMLDQFSLELDDNSHHEISRVLMDSWNLIRQGEFPQISKRRSGAASSITKDYIEEVSSDDDDDVDMDTHETTNVSHPRIVTDEDGWSTVVRK